MEDCVQFCEDCVDQLDKMANGLTGVTMDPRLPEDTKGYLRDLIEQCRNLVTMAECA